MCVSRIGRGVIAARCCQNRSAGCGRFTKRLICGCVRGGQGNGGGCRAASGRTRVPQGKKRPGPCGYHRMSLLWFEDFTERGPVTMNKQTREAAADEPEVQGGS